MRVDKVILRAALSTLAAILVLCTFMMLALCFIYPSTMMQITYDMGFDAASVKYAERAYERSDDIYYIAFATELSILNGDEEKIASCGQAFIAHDGFETYCNQRNTDKPQAATGSYQQYVYGQVYAASYKVATTTQEKLAAIDGAFATLEENTFPKNNAAVAVILAALGDNDAQALVGIKNKMDNMNVGGFSENDKTYFDGIRTRLGV